MNHLWNYTEELSVILAIKSHFFFKYHHTALLIKKGGGQIEATIPCILKLSSAVQPSWSEGWTIRHNFGRGPSTDYFIKVWFQLSNWFQIRRFLCEFPIGSYVKPSSAVGAILIEGLNRRTHFWKRTIQWPFHQNLVLIEQMVSDKKIFMGISHRVLC